MNTAPVAAPSMVKPWYRELAVVPDGRAVPGGGRLRHHDLPGLYVLFGNQPIQEGVTRGLMIEQVDAASSPPAPDSL
ncbi:hypothetical protein WJ978_30575 [Achromobacter xylosoxidans]